MPDDSRPQFLTETCSRLSRCHRFISCDYCAARRQARFADVAERIEAAFGPLQFAVITPDENTQTAIARAKRALLRASLSPALIWSVEVGIIAGRLHLNILGPNLDPPGIKAATVHIETAQAPARAMAAYITKRAAYPPQHLYDGRAVGTAGHVMQYLAQASAMPVAQGAALLKIIDTAKFNRRGIGLSPAEIDADLHKIVAAYVENLKKFADALPEHRAK